MGSFIAKGTYLTEHNRYSNTWRSQCGASFILKVEDVKDFSLILEELKKFDLVIVPYEKETVSQSFFQIKNFIQTSQRLAIVVGPEGGFSNDEITSLEQLENVRLIGLTKTILKSDTASFYTIANVTNLILEGEYHHD